MNSAAQAPSPSLTAWLSREPILTKAEQVEGYELLFRQQGDEESPEKLSRDMIDTVNLLGVNAICDGHLGFIKSTREMLLKDYFLLLPPDQVVIEIPSTIAADAEVLAACKRYKEKNYRLALDNVRAGDAREPLASIADFVKVELRQHSPETTAALVAVFRRQMPNGGTESGNARGFCQSHALRLHSFSGIFFPDFGSSAGAASFL
jgi:EAL and modified HD-GYP domain-containing signal transduction protein